MTSHAATSCNAAGPRLLRLAYVVSHPIQYQAPLLRRIAREPDIDLTVFFGSDFSLRSYRDEGFGVDVAWDIPLTEGYKHVFLRSSDEAGNASRFGVPGAGLYKHLHGADGLPTFDALWVHGYASSLSMQAILAANALGIPVLLRAESWFGDRERSRVKLALKAIAMRALEPLIAAALPIGSRNAAYWSHYFGERVPQFAMPYAVDNEAFARRADEAATGVSELRSWLHIEPGRPIILFASKLQPRKHCDDLIAACGRLQHTAAGKRLRPYLVIAGDGEERARLEAQCRKQALPDVRFVGFQNQTQLPGFFALADVFVLPSRHEPWGLIVNEAMAAGCPVIVSDDVGAHADLVADGVNGFVYPVGDVPALAAALESIFAAPELAATMGMRATERMQSWTFEQDVAGLRTALAHVTGRLRA